MKVIFCGNLKKIFQSEYMIYQIDHNDVIFVDEFKLILAQRKSVELNILNDTLFMQSKKILYGTSNIDPKENLYILPPILGG